MSTHTSIHLPSVTVNAADIKATAGVSDGAPLNIVVKDDRRTIATVTIFTNSFVLSEAIANAINGAVAKLRTCDICERPTDNRSFMAYGIETTACDECREERP